MLLPKPKKRIVKAKNRDYSGSIFISKIAEIF